MFVCFFGRSFGSTILFWDLLTFDMGYGPHIKVVLLLSKVSWADPCVITAQGSAHAILRSTRTTLPYINYKTSWQFKFKKLLWNTQLSLWNPLMYIQAFHWKLSLSLKASYVLAVSKANNLDMFGATICTKVEKFRQTYCFIIMYILPKVTKSIKLTALFKAAKISQIWIR